MSQQQFFPVGLAAALLAGVVGLAPGLAPVAAWAQSAPPVPGAGGSTPSGEVGTPQLHLSSADAGGADDADDGEDPWHPRLVTANKIHQYLGLGSLLAAGAAALSAPDSEGAPVTNPKDSNHHDLAVAAAYLGGAAIGTGLVFHWDDFYFRDGITDPDVLHALLGILGTAGYFIAIDEAPASTHQDAGMAGLVAMLLSVKIEW